MENLLDFFEIPQTEQKESQNFDTRPVATTLPRVLHENNLVETREKFNQSILEKTMIFHNTLQKSIHEVKMHKIVNDIYPITMYLMKLWGVFYDDFEYGYTIDEDKLSEHDKMRLCFQKNITSIVEFVMLANK